LGLIFSFGSSNLVACFYASKPSRAVSWSNWSYRNQEGQPRQRVIVSLGDAQLPDPEQALIYQHLGIRWKAAFRPTKSYAN
jgi:hypothetical protein